MPIIQCPNCHADVFVEAKNARLSCKNCQKIFFLSDGEIISDAKVVEERSAEQKDQWLQVLKSGDTEALKELPLIAIDTLASGIILTTAHTVAGRQIDREVDVITAECAFGMNIFKDVFAAVSDVVGGRSRAIQDTLRDARKTALTELRREALLVGADAVIGIDLDYSEFSGSGKSMLFLVASGTAVKLRN